MNEEEAIRHCQNGDREAFRHLVERYKDVLYGTAYLMTGDTTVAEDQVQEAFILAWRGLRHFQTGRPLKPWLVRILVNKVLSHRRQSHPAAMSLPEEQPGDGAAAEFAEDIARRDQVKQALDRLSAEHRQVVMLKYFSELTVAEMSSVLGCREGTVKSRLHRALEQLRQTIEG
ncbi:MAG: RNA polymerase sigma factor [Chloroflexi bacterium]|nr:RNA polymerase sigma factor [Chloroflexota bacterium]